MKEIPNAPDFLHTHGLIFEVNRKVLHPLGLALGFEADEATGAAVGPLKQLFDFGEPTMYAENLERDRDREAAIAAFRASRGLERGDLESTAARLGVTRDELLAARGAYALAHNASVRVEDVRRGDLCTLRKVLGKLDDFRDLEPALAKVLGVDEP